MPSVGAGQHRIIDDLVPWDVQYELPTMPTRDSPGWAIARDWYWGGYPPAPTTIPYGWIAPPARQRLEKIVNVATVARLNGDTYRAFDRTSISRLGENGVEETVDSAVVDDPATLAAFLIEYTGGRWRNPSLRIQLSAERLTAIDRWRILSCEIGDRIVVTGTPITWPAGVDSLLIEGIAHELVDGQRWVTWSTVPILGATPGEPGPWFLLDESSLDGTDIVPF